MEIINNFGFEPVFFVAQMINFLILAAIFKRYLYKPVLKMLSDREIKIAQGLKNAEEATKALENAVTEKDEIIKEVTLQAEKIIEETKDTAAELRESMTAAAKVEAEKIIKEAQETAAAEFEKAKNRSQDLALDLSKSILDKIISEVFTQDEKQKIIQRSIGKLKNYGRS